MEKNLIPELRFPEFSEEWEVKSLDDIATITMGQSPKSNSYNTKKKGVPLIQGNSDITNRKSDPLSYTTQPTKVCSKNDLILSVRAPVGHIAVSKHDACIGRGVCSISSSSNSFLYYYLLLNENKWAKYEQGSTFKAINSNDIRSFKIKIPLAAEQRKISSFFLKLDEKIDLQKNYIDKLKVKKKGLMQRIFSREVRFKDEDGNDYPEWEEKNFDNVFNTIPAKKYQILAGEIQAKGKHPVVTQSQDLIEGYTNNTQKLYTDTPIVLFGDHTTTIKFIDFDCVFGGDGVKLLTNKKTDSSIKYLYYALQYKNVEQDGYKRHFSALREQQIPLPSFEEQKKIANILQSMDRKIEFEENLLKKYEDFKKGLMQKMFV